MLPALYSSKTRYDASGRFRYQAERQNAPFASAYGVPAPTEPNAQAVAAQQAMAARANLIAGLNARYQWIGGYERGGRVVKGHYRARRMVSRIPDAAIETQCAEYDALHAGM